MKPTYFILLFLFSFSLKTNFLIAQTPYLWQDKDFDEIKTFEILLDKNYTFEQILNDSSLVFQENPKQYKFEKEDYCWFRFSIQNPSIHSQDIFLILIPEIHNILYDYDWDSQKWQTKEEGIGVVNFKRNKGFFSVFLPAQKTSTFYIKLSFPTLFIQ